MYVLNKKMWMLIIHLEIFKLTQYKHQMLFQCSLQERLKKYKNRWTMYQIIFKKSAY